MERGEWDEDAEYPRAPLPPHERTWRHPSEHGQSAWVQSEPPLVVGRGLSVATGTVGVVLAAGLLWLMIPHHSRSGGVAQVTSTTHGNAADAPRASGTPLSIVSTSAGASSLAESSTEPSTGPSTEKSFVGPGAEPSDDPDTAPSSPEPSADTQAPGDPSATEPPESDEPADPSSSAAGTSSSNGSQTTSGSSGPAAPTTLASSSSTGPTNSSGPSSSSASTTAATTTAVGPPPTHPAGGVTYAVALTPGHFVASTAAAVGTQSSVPVKLPDGATVIGNVVDVDAGSGIAILSIPIDVQTTPLTPSASTKASATVMAPEPTPASIVRGSDGTKVIYDPSAPVSEGSLVLDESQHVIGICTKSAGEVRVLEASALVAAINGAMATERPPWLGARAEPTGAGDVVITEVMPGGPVETAGIAVGDVVRAVDGKAVATLDALRAAAFTNHRPGDTVTLTVVKVGSTEPIDVPVVLAENPGL